MNLNAKEFLIRVDKISGRIESNLDLGPKEAGSHDAVSISCGAKFVSIECVENTLRFRADRYFSIPVFFAEQQHCYLFASHDFLILQELQTPKLNEEMARLFLQLGYLPPGKTFVQELSILRENFDLLLGQSFESRKPIRSRQATIVLTDLGADEQLSLIKQALKSTIGQILASERPSVFRMSGGVDTRTMIFLMSEKERSSLRLETVVHHDLNADTDADVACATLLCKALNLPIDTLQSPEHYWSFFFGRAPGTKFLSGLFGGEFLGGTMYAEEPKPLDLANWQDLGILLSSDEMEQNSRWRESIRVERAAIGDSRWLVDLFRTSYRSTIYSSIGASWSAPWIHESIVTSPFSHPDLLDLILGFPREAIENYKIYAALYAQIRQSWPQEIRNIPLNSQITAIDQSIPRAASIRSDSTRSPLINAKTLPAKNLNLFPERIRRLQLSLARLGIHFTETNLQVALNSQVHRTRLLNLGIWCQANARFFFSDLMSIVPDPPETMV